MPLLKRALRRAPHLMRASCAPTPPLAGLEVVGDEFSWSKFFPCSACPDVMDKPWGNAITASKAGSSPPSPCILLRFDLLRLLLSKHCRGTGTAVLSERCDAEMAKIHAASVSAQMVDDETFWDWPHEHFPHPSMSKPCPSQVLLLPIASLGIELADPFPAVIRVLSHDDKLPKGYSCFWHQNGIS